MAHHDYSQLQNHLHPWPAIALPRSATLSVGLGPWPLLSGSGDLGSGQPLLSCQLPRRAGPPVPSDAVCSPLSVEKINLLDGEVGINREVD